MTKVALIVTTPRGDIGSMTAYAKLVEHVLKRYGSDRCQVEVIYLLEGCPDCSWLPLRWQWRIQQIWLMLIASRRLNRLDADIIHLLDGSFAHVVKGVSYHKQVVITVHDLIPLLQSQGKFPVPPPNRLAQFLINRGLNVLKSRSNSLCAVSLSTAKDLTNSLNLSTLPTVIHQSIRSELVSHTSDACLPWSDRVWNGYRYILHVGNNGFYKNRTGVLKVFAKISQHTPVKMILAGASLDDKLKEQAQELGILSCLKSYPNPTDKQLVQLYTQASILLFPSYYEGFGWPPLEAMLFGCPVVCSNTGSLPEIVGNAALTAAPEDYLALAQHCLDLLRNPSHADELIQRGRENLKRFNERQMGLNLLDFYLSLTSLCL